MKRKSVGVLLSALVFPGVGQYYMGRLTRALLFLVPAVFSIVHSRRGRDSALPAISRGASHV